ncbi:unnamed protein product [Soboliphyme baturini]|uniref:Lectin_legB domain-containing protein n=1 Tax=Soboliphyme baturini TaxID=241478 RepID=A0A183J8B8_9BILA|nr:unnamed protein product [Soboliphyme baturini]
MVGYGPEDDHFVVELTYNYGIHSYEVGSHFVGFELCSKTVYKSVFASSHKATDDQLVVRDPNGYSIFVKDATREDPFSKVILNVSELKKSLVFWHDILNMTIVSRSATNAVLSYGPEQCPLEIRHGNVGRGSGFGRIAFACPSSEVNP